MTDKDLHETIGAYAEWLDNPTHGGATVLAQEVPDLVAEVRRMREALAYYADPENWCFDQCTTQSVLVDDVNGWERAAAALAPESGEDQRR